MSSRAPNWFEQKYVAGAIMALQTKGYLTKGMAMMETDIKGNQVTWKIAGIGTATVMSPAVENRPVMNANRLAVTGTMVDYEANEWVLSTDIEKMSQNEQTIAQETAGMALGRRYDSVLFSALDAAAGTIPTIGDGTTAMSPLNIMDATGAIAAGGIQAGMEWFCAIPFKFYNQLMLYREVSSSDFVGPEYPLRRMMGSKVWNGVTIVPMPDPYFNIPSANQADGYLWLKQGVGAATNYELKSRIDYVPEKKSYFAGNTMGMLAAVLLPGAVRRLRFSTNTALSRPTP